MQFDTKNIETEINNQNGSCYQNITKDIAKSSQRANIFAPEKSNKNG